MLAEKQWATYEEVAGYILDTFTAYFGVGRTDERKLPASLKGNLYELDGKGFANGNMGYFVLECRRSFANNRKDICKIAFQLEDTGAIGGIIVSPVAFKEGLSLMSVAKNLKRVQCNGINDKHQLLSFLNSVMYGNSDILRRRISSLSLRMPPVNELSLASKG